MSQKPKLIAIVGPTAGGKTALSIALAKRLSGEVVSFDSMQIYRHMNIGTAKPTPEEREGVPHHLIDILEPEESFSCADFVLRAKAVIHEILGRGHVPILCGGTGLYLDALLRGGEFEESAGIDENFRRQMNAFAEEHGALALHDKLRQVDPESAETIHPHNVKRVIRALEIYHGSGMRKSELDRRSQEFISDYDATVIGLRYADRERLYERINRRVDTMLNAGLLDEVISLRERGVFERSVTAAQAIGYKELLYYLRGDSSMEEATEALKTATRRYAKRQMTWFSAKPYVVWFEADGIADPAVFETIVNGAVERFSE